MPIHPLFMALLAGVLAGGGCRQSPAEAPTAQASEPRTSEKLVVSCCSMPCFPGNMLGPPCDLPTLRRRFDELAAKQGRKTGEALCRETTTPCNRQCESPPGHLLTCAQPD